VRRGPIDARVRQNVEAGSDVDTDALRSYDHLSDSSTHQVIDHAEADARGKVHTNGLENFWSLVKRAIKGTYVSVEPSSTQMVTAAGSPRGSARSRVDASTTRRSPANGRWRSMASIMHKTPDPSPPPKESTDQRRFRRLLKKLVAVPVAEIHEMRQEYRKDRKRVRRRTST